MGARGASTFPLRNRLPYPFSLVVRPLFCFVVCWHSLPFQDKYVSGDSVNFRGSDTHRELGFCRAGTSTEGLGVESSVWSVLPFCGWIRPLLSWSSRVRTYDAGPFPVITCDRFGR